MLEVLKIRAFERFLKYYHLLELNFDYVVDRIQKLNIVTDSMQISSLLNEYKKDDLERLKYLAATYCKNITPLTEKMNFILPYLPIAKEIFTTLERKPIL